MRCPGYTLFLGVPVRVLVEEISIELVVNKEDLCPAHTTPYQYKQALSKEIQIISFLDLGCPPSALRHCSSFFSGSFFTLSPLDSD